MRLVVLALLVGAGIALAAAAHAWAGCGLPPMKPMPPMGCRDMVAECVCDARGENCHWEWRCVR